MNKSFPFRSVPRPFRFPYVAASRAFRYTVAMRYIIASIALVAAPVAASPINSAQEFVARSEQYVALCEGWVLSSLPHSDSQQRLAQSIADHVAANGLDLDDHMRIGMVCGAFAHGMAAAVEQTGRRVRR